MKAITLIFISLNSLFYHYPTKAEEAEKTGAKTDLQSTIIVEKIKLLVDYPELKLNYMDQLEADIIFKLDSTQCIEIIRINTDATELKPFLNKNLAHKKVEGLEGLTNNTYRLHLTFN